MADDVCALSTQGAGRRRKQREEMDPEEGRQKEEIPRECGQGHKRHMQRPWKIEGRQREESGRHMQRAWKMMDPEEGRHREDIPRECGQGHKCHMQKEGRHREDIPKESGHMQRAWKGGVLWSQGHRYEAGRDLHRMWTDAGKYRRFKVAHPDAVRWTYVGHDKRQRQRDKAEKHRAYVGEMWADGASAGCSHVEHSKDQLQRQRHRDKAEREWSNHRSSVVQKKSGSAAVAPKKSEWCRQREEMDPEEGRLSFWSKEVIRVFGSVTVFKEGDWGWHLRMQSETNSSVQRVSTTVYYEEGSTKECLPLHLIAEHIFTRLSVRQRCQLRCVCKAWNSCLTWDPLKTEEAEYWFVLLHIKTKELIFCSSHGDCHPLRLRQPVLPYVFHRLSVESDFGLLYLLVSAGGLMCARVCSGDYYEVLVFNCLTGAVNVLPRSSRDPTLYISCFLYFAVDSEDPCRYYVLLSTLPLTLDACDIAPDFEVFDSRAGVWKVGQPLHSTTTKSSQSKVVDGDFFNRATCTSDDILSVQAYHVSQGAWSTVQVSLGSFKLNECDFNAFLKYKGRLFLCFIYVNESKSSFGLQVLELQSTDSDTCTCVEVARTPEHLCQPWNDDNTVRVEAEGYIFYTVWDERHWARITLVYDVAHDSWSVVPLTEGYVLLTAHSPTLSMSLA